MSLKKEILRKSWHLLLIIIPIYYYYFGKESLLKIIIPLSFVVIIIDYFRHNIKFIKIIFNKIFLNALRDHEINQKKFCGATWVFLGASINFGLFRPHIAITGFTILVISDALAALIGKSIKSRSFYEKSLSGSLAFFLSALMILVFYGWLYQLTLSYYFFGIITICYVTMLEARPSLLKFDDNILIPLSFSIVMTLFNFLIN
jgi:dolichol kinase